MVARTLPLATLILCGFSLGAGPIDLSRVLSAAAISQAPAEQPVILWKFTSEKVTRQNGTSYAVGLSDTAVADGVVYFGDDKGRLFALKSTTGDLIWRHEHGFRISVAPSVDKDHVYFGSEKGVTAVRRDHGDLVWLHPVALGGAGETTPLAVGNRVYTSGYDGTAYGLDQATGKVIWTHDFVQDAPPDVPDFPGTRARMEKSAARPRGSACDGKIFVQTIFDQSRVIAVDCATGKRLWSCSTNGWPGAGARISGNRVYVTSQDKHLYCLNHDTGEVLWKYKAPAWLGTDVAVFEDKVILPSHRGRLIQIAADSGREIRRFETTDESDLKALAGSAPLIANGIAYFCSGKGQVYAVDIASNQLKWKFRPSPDSGIASDPTSDATDGFRFFITCRQEDENTGECAVIAIGPK